VFPSTFGTPNFITRSWRSNLEDKPHNGHSNPSKWVGEEILGRKRKKAEKDDGVMSDKKPKIWLT
jgi:hypothetical protein